MSQFLNCLHTPQASSYSSTESPSSDRYQNIFALTLFGSLLLLISLSSLLLYMITQSGSSYCELSSLNDCHGQIVEIRGRINSSLYSGLGYLFKPQDLNLTNPIYIKSIKYSGYPIGGTQSTFEHNLPRSTTINIKGKVDTLDHIRCTEESYQSKNSYYCRPENQRVLITPISVTTIPSRNQTSFSYHILGSFNSTAQEINQCPSYLDFCENVDDGQCLQVKINSTICSQLKDIPQKSYYISGYTTSLKQLLIPVIYYINSIDYSSRPITNTNLQNTYQKYQGNKGKVKVYNSSNKLISTIELADNHSSVGYYNTNQVIPTGNGVYYFYKNRLYFLSYSTDQSTYIGELGVEYLKPDSSLLQKILLSPNEDRLIFLTSRFISTRTKGVYAINTNHYYLLELNLNNPTSSDDKLQVKILYEKEFEGFLTLEGYNFDSRQALLSYRLHEEMSEDCTKAYVDLYRVSDDESIEIINYYEYGYGNQCGESLYKKLKVDPKARYLILGKDFNTNPNTQKDYALQIITIDSDGKFNTHNYSTETSLLTSTSLYYHDIVDTQLNLIDLARTGILYNFDLSKKEFTLDHLVPVTSESEQQPGTPPDSSLTTKLKQFRYPQIVLLKGSKLYLLVRDNYEKYLYQVDLSEKSLNLIGSYSVVANYFTHDSDFYIIDTYY